jgi:hypothetical protein
VAGVLLRVLTLLGLVLFSAPLFAKGRAHNSSPTRFTCVSALQNSAADYKTEYSETRGFFFLAHVEDADEIRFEIRNDRFLDRSSILAEVLKYRSSWHLVSLNQTIYRLLGPNVEAQRSGRKVYYFSKDKSVDVLIVDDPVGHYFRIMLKDRGQSQGRESASYPYVDIHGKRIYRDGPIGKAQFQQLTHFNYAGELYEGLIEEESSIRRIAN